MNHLDRSRPKYNKVLCFIFLVIFCFNGFILSARSAEPQLPDVFSGQYIEENLSLSPQTNAESFYFISHAWAANFVNNLLDRFKIITLFDQSQHQQFLGMLKIEGEPLTDIHDLGKWDNGKINYEAFLNLPKLYQKRRLIPSTQILQELDHILVNIVRQERYFASSQKGALKTLYKHFKTSFHEMIRTLMLLRSDIEIACLLVTTSETASPAKQAEELIRPCMGRIFFVERKENKRVIRLIGSGTVVEIHGRKWILTCRHFNPISPDNDLEIYFIPSTELNMEDYLPQRRLVSETIEVDWDSYQHYSVTRISFLNTPDMESKLFLGNKEPIIIPKGAPIHLPLEQIKILKKIEDSLENDDLAIMEIKEPHALQHACRVEPETVDLNSEHIWVAGYPADGLTSSSFVVVGPSKSQLYKSIIAFHDERLMNPHWHYRIASFPTSHGISGGPIFLIRDKTPVILAAMTGIDFKSLGVLCSMITPHHIDILK